jgi:hypothetical protein
VAGFFAALGDSMTFPDTLPDLSEEERERINQVLREKLAALLGWSQP